MRQVNLRIEDALLDRVDGACGEGSRNRWIIEAIQMRLHNRELLGSRSTQRGTSPARPSSEIKSGITPDPKAG